VVGLGFPDAFALGAAMGVREVLISSSAIEDPGIRTATVGNPADTDFATSGFLSSTKVNGPGQNSWMRRSAVSLTRVVTRSSISRLLTWEISGVSEGLPF